MSNKHVMVAALVAPVLALCAYFGVDFIIGERPKAAEEGNSYPLVEKPNCRYDSGFCGLRNGDFELVLSPGTAGPDRLVLELESVFPLEGVMVALVDDENPENPPLAMEPRSADGLAWSREIPIPDPEKHRLHLAASAGGSLYYGDVSTKFTLGIGSGAKL